MNERGMHMEQTSLISLYFLSSNFIYCSISTFFTYFFKYSFPKYIGNRNYMTIITFFLIAQILKFPTNLETVLGLVVTGCIFFTFF